MMLEETKDYIKDCIINLHDQARECRDTSKSMKLRNIADELSQVLKKDKDALYRL